jgi:hypothetical protein
LEVGVAELVERTELRFCLSGHGAIGCGEGI